MNGDAGLLNNITGMEPDEKKFSSAFVVQPVSRVVNLDMSLWQFQMSKAGEYIHGCK